jgi:hypothetical protein
VYAVTAVGDWLLLGEFSAQLLQDRDFSTNRYILVDAAGYHRRRFEGHSGTGDLSSAQQPAMPVIGYLGVGSRRQAPACGYIPPGLAEAGYVEGENVGIAYRSAEHQGDRLPVLVADLVRVGVEDGSFRWDEDTLFCCSAWTNYRGCRCPRSSTKRAGPI